MSAAPATAVRSVVQDEDQICCYRSITSSGTRALWEIVRACNLKCNFCLVPDGSFGLPLEVTSRIARELVDAGVRKVLISGGEPLLYKPIQPIVEYLVDNGALVKVLTNGTVHRPPIFELINRRPEIELSLSLHSADEQCSDEIFGRKGAHARLMRVFDLVDPRRIHVNVVCSKLNVGEIEGILDWAEGRGVGSVSLINVFQNPKMSGRFLDDCHVHGLSASAQSDLLELVRRRRRDPAHPLVIRTLNFTSPSGCETCGAGRSIIYINDRGQILPCTLTDNTGYAEMTAGLTVGEALARFREAVPERPPSHCAPALERSWAEGQG